MMIPVLDCIIEHGFPVSLDSRETGPTKKKKKKRLYTVLYEDMPKTKKKKYAQGG